MIILRNVFLVLKNIQIDKSTVFYDTNISYIGLKIYVLARNR